MFAQKLNNVTDPEERASTFWRQASLIHGSITPHVLPNVALMGAFAFSMCVSSWLLFKYTGTKIGLSVAPYEFVGTALGLLLVFRTNGGYERWWEARKLWGGIVNQCRNLAISATSYGPKDDEWQDQFLRWVAVFPYAAKDCLRKEVPSKEITKLIGEKSTMELSMAEHMPSYVVAKLAELLRVARERHDLDGFVFNQMEKERLTLIDHIGACERIKKTPLPLPYSIKIRRFIAMYLITLPFALIHDLGHNWLVPMITMMVAYPIFSLDQLGVELQNPFDRNNLSHLPLDEISATIEKNVLAMKKNPHCAELAC